MCSAEQYNHFANIVKCYGDAKTADCANPPENVLGGILNESYTHLRTMDHCFDHTNGLLDSNLKVEFEYALRLMYFKNVKSNYARFHAKDLTHFNEALSHYPIPANLALADLENMTRQELVKRLKGLQMYSPLMRSQIQANIKSIQNSLVDLNIKSIPPAWIKPFARDGIPAGYDEFKM